MKVEKIEEAKTFADWAQIAIAKHTRKMLKHESAVLKDKDPEELHQMRVGMRRLRSAIAGFSSAIILPETATEKQVGRVAKTLGKLRDLDVLKEALETHYKPALPQKEQKELNKALKLLEKHRQDVFETVRDTLKSKKYAALKKGLAAWLEDPQFDEIGSVPLEIVLPDLLLPQVSELLLHPGWWVSAKREDNAMVAIQQHDARAVDKLLNENAIALHDLRKEAKQSRYQMELFESFYGENYSRFLQEIKAIQEILGEIQDSFVLAEFLEDILEESIARSLPTLAEQLQETRHERWQAWQKLQQTFLAPQNRGDLRLAVQETLESHSVERQELALTTAS